MFPLQEEEPSTDGNHGQGGTHNDKPPEVRGLFFVS